MFIPVGVQCYLLVLKYFFSDVNQPFSITQFADDLTQAEQTLIDGTALFETITRVFPSLF